MITEQELKEIEQRCSLAQSMPWKAYIEGRDHESGSNIIKTGESDQKGEDMEILGLLKLVWILLRMQGRIFQN